MGSLILAGDLDLAGVTNDGVAAVLDRDRGALAVQLSGGDFQVVDAMADTVSSRKNLILSMHNLDQVSGFGDLTVWTAAGGAVPLATGSTGVLAFNDDGSRMLATMGSSSDGTTTNLMVAGANGVPPIIVRAAARGTGCSPRASFVQSWFVASHCDPGSNEVIISSIDPVSGAVTDLLSMATNQFVVVSGPPATVAAIGVDRRAVLVPVAGGAATVIGTDAAGLAVVPDGSAVLLLAAGAISRVPISGDAPIALSGSAGVTIWAVSADGKQMLYRSRLGPRNGYGDLILTAADFALPVTTLSESLDATTFGDAFTYDSSRVLYVTQANDLFVGVLQSLPVAGGPVRVHGKDVWATRSYLDTRIVFNDDYVPVPKRSGRATIRAVDTAQDGARPTVIATSAGAYFSLTEARDQVVFAVPGQGARAGLYAAPLP